MTVRTQFFIKSPPAYSPVGDPCYSAKLGIIGAGGLGSNLAVFLCRMGFTHMTIADFDSIEPSNLNRQVYGYHHIGRPKVEVLAEIVERTLPDITIRTLNAKIGKANIKKYFGECKVVADCTDLAQNKSHVVETALIQLSCPIVSASGIGGRLVLRKIGCERKFGGRLWVIGDQQTSDCAGVGVTTVAAAAGAMAEAIYDICLSHKEPT